MKSRVLKMLRTGLDLRLTYHSTAHTEDVLQQVERIATAENIDDAGLFMEEEEYEQNALIFQEGEIGDCMYIIYQGEVKIHKGIQYLLY